MRPALSPFAIDVPALEQFLDQFDQQGGLTRFNVDYDVNVLIHVRPDIAHRPHSKYVGPHLWINSVLHIVKLRTQFASFVRGDVEEITHDALKTPPGQGR